MVSSLLNIIQRKFTDRCLFFEKSSCVLKENRYRYKFCNTKYEIIIEETVDCITRVME